MKETYNGKHIGDFEIDDKYLTRVIKITDYGEYESKVIITKKAFIMCYNKWIKGKESKDDKRRSKRNT